MRTLPKPDRRLTSGQSRKASKFRSSMVDPVIEILNEFTPDAIGDLFARGDHSAVPDGYPTSSRSSGHGSEIARPTESGVLALYEHRDEGDERPDVLREFADPIKDIVDEFRHNASEMLRLAKRQRQLHSAAVNAGVGARGDVEVSPLTAMSNPQPARCQACGREVSGRRDDRLQDGYCPKHYMQAYRLKRELGLGQFDRVRFEAMVREELAS